jgi:hypothetical protein
VEKSGTGPVGDNTAEITNQTGLPNPGTVAVISNIGTTAGPGTQANTPVIISTAPNVTALILGSFQGGGLPEQTMATVTTGATPGSKPGTTSGTSPRVSTYLLQNFALLGVTGVALIFFML